MADSAAQGTPPGSPASAHPGRNVAPTSTYRLQLNRDFTFRDATALVPYLRSLGVSHCYTSPYLMARPGSTHGYDIIDHTRLNPELGTPEDYESLCASLTQHGMGQIADIVPNHMGVMGSENRWWLDVLENGPAALHADFFDIDWKPVKKELLGKVLLPILGDHYGTVLYSGELVLRFDPEAGEFSFWYGDHRFPADPRSYADILDFPLPALSRELGAGRPCVAALADVIDAFRRLPGRSALGQDQRECRRRDKEACKKRLARVCADSAEIRNHIDHSLALLNGTPDAPESFDRLHALLEAQAYRLAFWKTAADEINYRRFFDINGLAGLCTENDPVFEAIHELVFRLVDEGKISGLRIDHIDGLHEPLRYLEKLKQRTSRQRAIYIVVEKILAAHEHLREDWPVHGTTGYDFSAVVNGVFVDPDGERLINLNYHRFIGGRFDYEEALYASKRRIVTVEMAGELNVLASQLNQISELDPATRDYTLNSLRHALTEIIACFPVYRTYVAALPVHADDRKYIEWAIAQAKKRSAVIETGVFDFIHSVLSLDIVRDSGSDYGESIRNFVMHFQQYTSPVMAKGLEDTALYRYNRLVSLNEVGGDPQRFGFSVNAFHYLNQERLRQWPDSMLSTSTHDSKRSEDVRARIDVLSEVPEEFRQRLVRWRFINRRHRRYVDKRHAPSRNDEYLLYQTLLGSWPLGKPDTMALESYRGRITQYMLKAVREAKLMTSWSYSNPEYEQAMTDFIDSLLDSPGNNAFLKDFIPFAEHLGRYGLYNSLAQCLLKLTAPGVPDLYQGNELFEFNLADPDNRRPVDYALRERLLDEVSAPRRLPAPETARAVRSLLDDMPDGRCKLYLTWAALSLRNRHRNLFQRGDYIPLVAEGARSNHVCAFARTLDGRTVVAVVPRLVRGLGLDVEAPPLGPVWADTRLELPESLPPYRLYHNELTKQDIFPRRAEGRAALAVGEVLAHFPVALLHGVAG